MKVPLSWLKEYVAVDASARELADRLALTGTEVERVTRVGITAEEDNLDRFVIGRVKSISPHPNADKLVLCQVETGGDGGESEIVCGAKNFKVGDKVAVCLPGGILPDGRRLEAAVIRGVESRGMLCSEAELGLAAESPGILVLPDDASVGERLADYLSVSDEVLELEVTPNRPDCLSIYGVAREVAAISATNLAPEPVQDVNPEGDDNIAELVQIEVADTDLCPRYGARIIAGVKIAPSPSWLKARIVAAGMRPVNNVVDITNYVMWTLGEPMHAFDLAKISGRKKEDGRMLIIRRALPGEKIITIDGTERELAKDMLVIADGRGPTAVAGIMGSEASEVSEETVDILLEAANFLGPNILGTSMELGLRSDSSTRFEKGLDPELVPKALAMASRLMVDLCGGRLVSGQVDTYSEHAARNVIHLRQQKLAGTLGIEVPPDECEAILSHLGFDVVREGESGDMRVTVPSFRADVEREVDLIEEVARVFGLELIPPTLPSEMRVMGGLTGPQAAERDITRNLAGLGLSEVITYSFIGPDFAGKLLLPEEDPRRRTVNLANPISVEQSLMRTLLLPGLLETVSRNLALRNPDVNIFELGRVYLPDKNGGLPQERKMIAGCICGSLEGETWHHLSDEGGYFTIKGLLESLCAGIKGNFEVHPAEEPFLHPGKSGSIYIGGAAAGYLGEIHPRVLAAFDIEKPVAAFELDQSALISSSVGIIQFEDLITFPASYQDIAIVIGDDVTAEQVTAAVREAGAPLLRSVRVFDIYEGEQVGAGKISIALKLEFRSPERTLTDEDVDTAKGAILASLGQRFGAQLRT